MPYILESWATLRADPSKAVKIHVKLDDEPGPNEFAAFRSKASGMFRNVYQVWADSLGEKVTET